MTGYLGHVLALLGALVGLVGDTWDKEQRGWRRLTLTGRLALFVVLVGFGVSVYATYSESVQRRQMQAAFAEELEAGWCALAHPFTLMLWQLEGQAATCDREQLERLVTPEMMARIGQIDIRGEAPHHHGPWRTVLEGSATRGRQLLESASKGFSSRLDEEVLLSAHEVLKSPYLEVLTVSESILQMVDKEPSWDGKPYPLSNLSDLREAERYLRALIKLKSEIDARLPESARESS